MMLHMPRTQIQYRPIFIRAWRQHRRLTLECLAEKTGLTSSASLSRYERGLQPYDQPILEALAAALGCEPADLFHPPGWQDPLRRALDRVPEHRRALIKDLIERLVEEDAA